MKKDDIKKWAVKMYLLRHNFAPFQAMAKLIFAQRTGLTENLVGKTKSQRQNLISKKRGSWFRNLAQKSQL